MCVCICIYIHMRVRVPIVENMENDREQELYSGFNFLHHYLDESRPRPRTKKNTQEPESHIMQMLLAPCTAVGLNPCDLLQYGFRV